MNQDMDEKMMMCGYCKRPFKKGQQIYIKGEGWRSIILMDNKCRKKFHSKLEVRP